MNQLKIVLPNKGRLHEPTLQLMNKSGIIPVEKDGRLLYSQTSDPEIAAIFIRASDIPKFIESGAADMGVTGLDCILESRSDVVELLDLEFGKAKIVVAMPDGAGKNRIEDADHGSRVATKYVNLTKAYLEKKGLKFPIIKVSGAAEIMPSIGVSDLVVDVMSTGATLKTHRLTIVDEVLNSSARLIANKASLTRNEAKMREVAMAFESVIRATRKKLIMMNVPERALAEVAKTIPSMGGPTVARIESPIPLWEVYSVIDESEVYRTISLVKRAGARDIIVLPIERIIP